MALGSGTFNSFGAAANDIFGGIGAKKQADIKAKGLLAEGQEYDLASKLARQNEQFEKTSTELQTAQQQRAFYMGIGKQQAEVAGAGFQMSGSALDLLASSAQQGALQKAAIQTQGLIKEAGYEEQAQSYDIMSAASKSAAHDIESAGTFAEATGFITGTLHAIAGIASLGT